MFFLEHPPLVMSLAMSITSPFGPTAANLPLTRQVRGLFTMYVSAYEIIHPFIISS